MGGINRINNFSLNNSLKEITREVSEHYQKLLNITPKRINLKILERGEWQDFCRRFNLNHNSEGIFLPRSLTAYLLEDSENFSLNLFHEYFGHSLFFEYSKQGKFLEKLEKKLEKEERINFKEKQFTLEGLSKFRRQNPNFRLLQKINDDLFYETFAIWTEHYLSEIFGIKDLFKQKYKDMPKEAKENLEQFLNYQQNYGGLALFYEIGMPKYYDANKIKKLLVDIFKDKIKSFKLALLYMVQKNLILI